MPAIIAAFMEGLMWLFRNKLGGWILEACVFLGISWAVHHVAVEPFINYVKAMAQGAGNGSHLSVTMVNWAGVLQFDRALSMIISAVATKVGVSGGRLFLQRRM